MDPKCYVVVTTVGSDRPGIVEDVTRWIFEQGGNVEDSRMSLLGGEFATLILVSGDPGIDKRMSSSLEAFQRSNGLSVFVKTVSGIPPVPGTPRLRYMLRATSLDHPGILHQVAHLLRNKAVNIVSATTRTSPAPFSGVTVFQIQMEVDIPSSVPVASLRQDLLEIGNRDNIDFTLTAAE